MLLQHALIVPVVTPASSRPVSVPVMLHQWQLSNWLTPSLLLRQPKLKLSA
jgi:hypothetical protein